MPFFCAAVLERRDDAFITLEVLRSQTEGYITDEQRHTFSLLAPQVRAALRLHAAVERKGSALLANSMETLAIPLFLCDSTGRVRRLTPAAQALVASGGGLTVTGGTLRAACAREDRALQDAITAALPGNRTPDSTASRTVVVHARQLEMAPVVLDVFALAHQRSALSLVDGTAQVLIVACGQRRAAVRREAILAAFYGLTGAETQVAQLLAVGRSAQGIADERGVSVGTVRVQIRAILSKLGVHRQAELAARLNQL
jgi:DNA-binding NarL/FixJ family response regulator